jgi:hypothetical protein
MSLTIFTGKSGGTVATYNSVTIPGWRKITITENGRPLPETIDVTDAGDAVYTFVDDPLGGKSNPSSSVTIEGFLSVVDKADGEAGLLQFAPGASYPLVVTTATSGDEWTLANCVFKTINIGQEVAAVVPYTLTFSHSTSAGTWGTDA